METNYQAFGLDPAATLKSLAKNRNLELLGGLDGIAHGLGTCKEVGIREDDDGGNYGIERRRTVFGSNTYPTTVHNWKNLLSFLVEASTQPSALLLLFLALLSLLLGLATHGGWYDGGMLFLVVFIDIGVSSVTCFRHNRQVDYNLAQLIKDSQIHVVRDGRRQKIAMQEIVVGDVVCLCIGDRIPADGLFVDGYSLRVDESSLNGLIIEDKGNQSPFLFCGTTVADGCARMLVTSVGVNTTWCQMMGSSSISRQHNNNNNNVNEPKLAQRRRLKRLIQVGFAVALLILLVILIAYFIGYNINTTRGNGGMTTMTKMDYILNTVVGIIAAAIAIFVVIITEGLPLTVAVALSLTYSWQKKKKMSDQAMVRKFFVFENFGSITAICTNKTGTLTRNKMKVEEFWVGQERALELIREGVSLDHEFSTPTEKAILSWADEGLGGIDYMDQVTRRRSRLIVLHVEAFNSEKKRSGILFRRVAENNNTTHHVVHWKGATEMVLQMCSRYYDASGNVRDLDNHTKLELERTIQGMAAKKLRCIAFAHAEIITEEEEEEEAGIIQLKEDGLTFLGVVGIRDPCHIGVKQAVEDFKQAGKAVKLITGEDVFCAKAIAAECGILPPPNNVDDEDVVVVVEGKDFENYTFTERLERVDQICVMARSTPSQKLLMVQCLQHKGHKVAFIGDSFGDTAALKEADVGLCMGRQSSQVLKASANLIILDNGLPTVAEIFGIGQRMRDSHYKFISVQFIVNVVAIAIDVLAAFKGGELPLTVGHICMGNIIIYILGTVGLVAQNRRREALPVETQVTTNLSNTDVIWNNVGKSLYQIALIMVIQLGGESIFAKNAKATDALIFSLFVLWQVFSEFYTVSPNDTSVSQFLTNGGASGTGAST